MEECEKGVFHNRMKIMNHAYETKMGIYWKIKCNILNNKFPSMQNWYFSIYNMKTCFFM